VRSCKKAVVNHLRFLQLETVLISFIHYSFARWQYSRNIDNLLQNIVRQNAPFLNLPSLFPVSSSRAHLGDTMECKRRQITIIYLHQFSGKKCLMKQLDNSVYDIFICGVRRRRPPDYCQRSPGNDGKEIGGAMGKSGQHLSCSGVARRRFPVRHVMQTYTSTT